jgi:hypothetical protein
LLKIVAEAVALKVLLVAPAATVTKGGTLSKPLLLTSETADPPTGAAGVNVTEHAEVPLALSVPGLQVSEDTTGTAMIAPTAGETLNPTAAPSVPARFEIVTEVVPAVGASLRLR